MAGKASKDKGKAGERELSKILEKYLGGSFQRVVYSGAMIGGSNQHRKEKMSEAQIRSFKSDITPPDDLPKLVIESKWYKDWPYHSFALNQSIPLLDKWIKELEHDCDEGDFGMLCVKINRKGWFVCVKNFNVDLLNHIVYSNYKITGLEKFLEIYGDAVKELSR